MMNMFRYGTESAMKVSVTEALRTRGDAARAVINAELQQMITRKVWTEVKPYSLTGIEHSRVIRSSMFLKEKFLPTGEFEKLKARLVAGGHMQNRDLYEDLSAPTVATASVFTVLAIAAAENRSIAAVDIGGAFLHADMSDDINVHMRLEPRLSGMMVELDPGYADYIDRKGCLTVKLDKALYGCVESAGLWYGHLSGTLESQGYMSNQYDQCVYNKTSADGVQCTITIHVDDLLLTSTDTTMIDDVREALKQRYGDIKEQKGPIINYLGMTLDASVRGEVSVTMKGYVDDLLAAWQPQGTISSPADVGLFVVGDSEKCEESVRKEYHTRVAKLLYLAKRARPDCLTTVSYLATRVKECNKDDYEKLNRLIMFIAGTADRALKFRPGSEGLRVSVYADAAFGVHPDGKSHTGSCVVIGDSGPVHCSSRKQGIVTKSSTESELVALSDSCNQGIHMRRFLMEQGYDMGPIEVFQDNKSTMAMIERGRSGAEKTRHIDIKYFWMKEQISTGTAVVTHLGTQLMYTNVLTKPIQAGHFKRESDLLMG